mmetsp:Transcript_45646/g.102880  ORF Transcript_45646/g.102880 Transcript_45646/m.102880 type:complete len:85 (+) Transcript_45646:934-1188(+)
MPLLTRLAGGVKAWAGVSRGELAGQLAQDASMKKAASKAQQKVTQHPPSSDESEGLTVGGQPSAKAMLDMDAVAKKLASATQPD